MARVDFYVLARAGEEARHVFACRLAEKAYRLDNKVHIETGDRGIAERLNELLWTFRDGSFVPHHVIGDDDLDSPVTIGCGAPAGGDRDLLINLCDDIPAIASAFPRIAELVTADDECRRASRRRFAAYRDQGHTLETHDV